MKRELNARESRYYVMIGNVGMTMCAFLILFHGGARLMELFYAFFAPMPISDIAYNVICDLLYGAYYLLAFMLPVLLLKILTKRQGSVYRSMYAEARVSPYLPLLILATVFCIRATSYVNFAWVSIFDYSNQTLPWLGSHEIEPYRIVLDFILTCIIPGFCEEFLFRGAILTNLLPFGRTHAILISAILFALMHQSADQLLYTFVAGLLLGLVYETTGSIWNCIAVHIVNNLFSLIDGVIVSNFYSRSSVLLPLWEGSLCLLGALSIGALICFYNRNKKTADDGFFGKDLPACGSYASCPVSQSRSVRLFFAPAMIGYLVLTVITYF
ncbi:MAG: CPBP family intramembrane metalloprotease [Clostridia bacterium]|nr:CPBP family intramembrane metalloprotease [Clostridia bacterium]